MRNIDEQKASRVNADATYMPWSKLKSDCKSNLKNLEATNTNARSSNPLIEATESAMENLLRDSGVKRLNSVMIFENNCGASTMPYSKLFLGTAGFGCSYGTFKNSNIPSQAKVDSLLNSAHESGFTGLDTAALYEGSELAIGNSGLASKFDISTKLSGRKRTNHKVNQFDINHWNITFERSLKNMKVTSVYSLSVHRANEIEGRDVERVVEWMCSLKRQGLIRYSGISLYSKPRWQECELLQFDLYQVPLNIYNRSAIGSGLVQNLISKGKRVQLRSIFLQGLLCSDSTQLEAAGLEHSLIAHHSKCMKKYGKDGLYKIAISYIKSLQGVDSVVFGTTEIDHLKKFINSWRKGEILTNIESLDCLNYKDVINADPRGW